MSEIFLKDLGIDLNKPFLLVTFHPVTLEQKELAWQITSLIKAIKKNSIKCSFYISQCRLGPQ